MAFSSQSLEFTPRPQGEMFMLDWDMNVNDQSMFNPIVAPLMVLESILPKDQKFLLDITYHYNTGRQATIILSMAKDVTVSFNRYYLFLYRPRVDLSLFFIV